MGPALHSLSSRGRSRPPPFHRSRPTTGTTIPIHRDSQRARVLARRPRPEINCTMQSPRISKSCDQCRNRKVRCLVPPASPGAAVACTHCIKRNETCQFSNVKRKLRSKTESSTSGKDRDASIDSTDLFIDRLIRNPSESAVICDEFSILKAHDDRVPSSGIAFFSDKRVDSLVKRLGNGRVKELVYQIDKTIRTRLLARPGRNLSLLTLATAHSQVQIEPEASIYIQCYFDVLHPIFPFLDRLAFEERAADPNLLQVLDDDFAFSALYHAVLALGCQYNGHSSFIPELGKAWKFFQISLSRVDCILLSSESLENLQALTAMMIFATNTFSFQLDQTLLAEAIRMVLVLRYHKSSIQGEDPELCHRAFWVIYHLEKRYCFQARSASAIADYDISCPIPTFPKSVIGEYNWFMSSIRYSRILSIAYESLFSVSASTRSDDSLLASIDRVYELLEDWRLSIPPDFRPREPLQRRRFIDSASKEIALRTQYYYYHVVIALERMTLHVSRNVARSEKSMRTLVNTAKAIIELTRFIDVEPYTPVFILAILPLSALFILFDFVVHHPNHPEIRGYLTLLDIVSGHFSQLDLSSKNALPANYLSEFSHIARDYVKNIPERPSNPSIGTQPVTEAQRRPGGFSLEAATTNQVFESNRDVIGHQIQGNTQTLNAGFDLTLSDLDLYNTDGDYWMNELPVTYEDDPRAFYGSIFL